MQENPWLLEATVKKGLLALQSALPSSHSPRKRSGSGRPSRFLDDDSSVQIRDHQRARWP